MNWSSIVTLVCAIIGGGIFLFLIIGIAWPTVSRMSMRDLIYSALASSPLIVGLPVLIIFLISFKHDESVFRKHMRTIPPDLIQACSQAMSKYGHPSYRASPLGHTIHPTVLCLYRKLSETNNWSPAAFSMRFTRLRKDRQAYYPETVRTVVIIDWETHDSKYKWSNKRSPEKYEWWEASLIDVSSRTVIATCSFADPPSRYDAHQQSYNRPETEFNKWINSLPLAK